MKVLIAIYFLLVSLNIFAETDSTAQVPVQIRKINFGANLSYFTHFDLSLKNGYSFTTSLVLKKDKHSLSVAPVWWIDNARNANLFKGGMVSYQYYPENFHKRINFYFIYDLCYTFEKNDWERNMEYMPNTFYDVVYNGTWHSFKNQVGYGFSINLYKGLYINQSMSLGIEFYNYTSKTFVKGNPGISGEYSSGNIFSGSDMSSFLKIGIGYNFEK